MSIYLDHNATTPLDERVLQAMLPYLKEGYGNASTLYSMGRAAKTALGTAREQVAALVGAHPSQVVFTSGGTEANNFVLKGIGWGQTPGHLLIGAVEHASVSAPAEALTRQGWSVEYLSVNKQGVVSPDSLQQLTERNPATQPALASLMWANNETGVIQPVEQLAEWGRTAGVPVHSDAVQAVGKLDVNFRAAGINFMTLSAHKINGPKGVGALITDGRYPLEPLLNGGGQEKSRRGGTENVAAIVGFGKAAELALLERQQRNHDSSALRDRFEQVLKRRVVNVVIFGEKAMRLPNTSFFAVPGIEGQTLILALDKKGIAVSSGSACGSHHDEPSGGLAAMGIEADLARCAVRISFGAGNRDEDVDYVVAAVAEEAALLQKMASSAW